MLENFITGLAGWISGLSNGQTMWVAFYAGLFVALMTSLGAMIALFAKRLPAGGVDLSLSFAAGVMLVASFTSLIIPAINSTGSFTPAGLGIALGILLIYVIDRFLPHEHLVKGYEGPPSMKDRIRKVWLLVIAVMIHNLPEGLAVGVSLVYSLELGLITTVAIGIQDFPEGTVISLPLAAIGGKRLQPVVMGVLSGLSEMAMVLVGAYFFDLFSWLLPYGLGLAGGAMLYVTIKEMVPEIYRGETSETLVTLGFFIGFYVMLFLDSMLG
ncbi:Gufa protein [Thermococcus sp. P6]|uniref:ZIP family metal transporter n=1 Tax=Thermococcus sp. P6 TaxID=122420 RepID=UPI000B59F10F|nr:ZIP family metal transporter [Thermococcus sp. P6]ASJ10003.1 Gufa protein [Thermococcus sp. P6]